MHVPFRIVKCGGRKAMHLPEGGIWAQQDGYYVGQGAGAGVSLEADAGVGGVHDHRRVGGARRYRAVLQDTGCALDAARTGHRGGHLRREEGAGNDARAVARAVPCSLDAANGTVRLTSLGPHQTLVGPRAAAPQHTKT